MERREWRRGLNAEVAEGCGIKRPWEWRMKDRAQRGCGASGTGAENVDRVHFFAAFDALSTSSSDRIGFFAAPGSGARLLVLPGRA